MKIIFFDTDSKVVVELKKKLGYLKEVLFIQADVKELLQNHRIDVLVSPANSFGFMDGGIDAVYSKLFPSIQNHVQAAIAHHQIESGLGYYLPVGSALPVPTTNTHLCPLLLCVPTMYTPSDIRGTNNAMWAFIAILRWLQFAVKVMPDVTVACPGMGTGIGKLSPETHAMQIEHAFRMVGRPLPSQRVLKQNSIKGYILAKPVSSNDKRR
jgi:O-acetyl-ADP-ribose deacetylase (regulator of RNase III)